MLGLFKKKKSKLDCVWNEPQRGAEWQWQSCCCPERLQEYCVEVKEIYDVSCEGMDCGHFKEKEKR
jgi:hypothetical protein